MAIDEILCVLQHLVVAWRASPPSLLHIDSVSQHPSPSSSPRLPWLFPCWLDGRWSGLRPCLREERRRWIHMRDSWLCSGGCSTILKRAEGREVSAYSTYGRKTDCCRVLPHFQDIGSIQRMEWAGAPHPILKDCVRRSKRSWHAEMTPSPWTHLWWWPSDWISFRVDSHTFSRPHPGIDTISPVSSQAEGMAVHTESAPPGGIPQTLPLVYRPSPHLQAPLLIIIFCPVPSIYIPLFMCPELNPCLTALCLLFPILPLFPVSSMANWHTQWGVSWRFNLGAGGSSTWLTGRVMVRRRGARDILDPDLIADFQCQHSFVLWNLPA